MRLPMRSVIRPAITALTIASLAVSVSVLTSANALAQAAKSDPAKPVAAPQAPAAQAEPAPAQVVPKQMALTDKQIEAVIAAEKDFNAVTSKLPETAPATPDPKVVAQYEAAAKKNGFASYAEYNEVVANVLLVLDGFDPKTKSYVGVEAALKQQITIVEADTKMAAEEKKTALEDMNAALKSPPPAIENKGNIELVTKYYDRLIATMYQK